MIFRALSDLLDTFEIYLKLISGNLTGAHGHHGIWVGRSSEEMMSEIRLKTVAHGLFDI